MYHPTRLLAYGFAIIILLMVLLAFIAFNAPGDTSQNVHLEVARQLEKADLINDLSSLVQQRTRFMQTMLLKDKEFIKDEAWPDFNNLGDVYVETREQLKPLLAPQDLEIMSAIDRIERDIGELNHQISVLFLNGSRDEANNILLQEVLPRTAPLLSQLSQLTRAQRLEVQQAMQLASNNAEAHQSRIALFAVMAILISLGVTILAVWYGRKLTHQLQDMNTYLEQKISERTETLLDTQKELLEDNNELARIALTDNLTGLPNRSHMNQILSKEFSRFKRHNHPFGIIMLDIDHFKKINDSFGHDAGDKVLRLFARTAEKAIRGSDIVARWGGEEFLICCTNISESDLMPIAENIRKLISSTNFAHAGVVTTSLGCAAIVRGESINELIKRADIALYEAKNNGRNQSMVSEFTDISLP